MEEIEVRAEETSKLPRRKFLALGAALVGFAAVGVGGIVKLSPFSSKYNTLMVSMENTVTGTSIEIDNFPFDGKFSHLSEVKPEEGVMVLSLNGKRVREGDLVYEGSTLKVQVNTEYDKISAKLNFNKSEG